MFRRIAGTVLFGMTFILAAGMTATDGGALAGDLLSLYDAPAAVGAGQAESLHLLAAGRLARLRSLRPEASKLPKIDAGGPSGSFVTGDSVYDMVANVREIPIYTGGYDSFGVWSRGFGQRTSVGNSDGASGFSGMVAGGSIGADWTLDDHWIVGGMAAASSGRMLWHDDHGSGDAAVGSSAVYASYFTDTTFLDMSLSVGWTQSSGTGETTNGFDRTDLTVGGRLDAGFDLEFAGVSFRPIASTTLIAVQAMDTDRSFPLAVDLHQDRLRQIRARLGVEMGRTFLIGDMPLEAQAGLSWRRGLTLGAASEPDTDESFRPMRTYQFSQGSLEPRFGLSLQFADQWGIYTRYNGWYDRNAERHTITTGLRGTF
jgi:outer membrane autotransporter protein